MADAENLSEIDDDGLVEAYVENIQAYERIEHIGAMNRQMDRRRAVVDELKRRGGGSLESLRPLLRHSDANVRLTVAIQFRRIDHAAFEETVKALAERSDDIGFEARDSLKWDSHFQDVGYPEDRAGDWVPPPPGKERTWQCESPPPNAMPLEELNQRIADIFPAQVAEALSRLARPAIGLWPQRPDPDGPANVSRLGGEPSVPDGWSWPMVETEPEDEPMLFLGQINCAELAGLPGAEPLPPAGMLSFFGDHDGVMGCCGNFGDTAVFYWTDTDSLTLASPPLEPIEEIVPCRLAFRPMTDIPHPDSHAIEQLLADGGDRNRYADIYRAVREYGIPEDSVFYTSFARLLGWPALVQMDLETIGKTGEPDDPRLLLQLDDYYNGSECTGWGPGGSLYFLLSDVELRERRFENTEFEIQFT